MSTAYSQETVHRNEQTLNIVIFVLTYFCVSGSIWNCCCMCDTINLFRWSRLRIFSVPYTHLGLPTTPAPCSCWLLSFLRFDKNVRLYWSFLDNLDERTVSFCQFVHGATTRNCLNSNNATQINKRWPARSCFHFRNIPLRVSGGLESVSCSI